MRGNGEGIYHKKSIHYFIIKNTLEVYLPEGVRLLTNRLGLTAGWIGFENTKENQFIDFRLITQSRKNRAFILLCQQPHTLEVYLPEGV